MKQYHVSVNGQQPLVVAEEVLAKEVAAGKYPENTLIWCEGMAGWEPIEKHFKLPVAPPPLPSAVASKSTSAPQSSVDESRTWRSIPSYVWKACLWFLFSLFFLFCALFGDDLKGYMQIKFWLAFFGALGWGIYTLDSGATNQNKKDKKS